jgi:probable O-glycosylation ligase (exosortase A-associated)
MKGLLFTFGLTFGGAVVALFNPFIGLLIYICFAIIKPEAMWFWSVPEGNYSRIVAVALLAGWVLHGMGKLRVGRARPIVLLLVGHWAWMAVTVAWAPDKVLALEAVEGLAKIVLPFLVGITAIHSVKQLKQLAWVIVLSQGYAAYEMNSYYFGGYNRLYEDGWAGMDNNCNAIALVSCVGLAFFLGLDARKWWQKGVAFAAAALMVHAILFSFSRGGMLALVITGVLMFWLLPKTPRNCLLFALAAVLAIRLAGPQVLARFQTAFAGEGQRDESAQSRIELWAACWDLMLKNPLGIGADQFPRFVSQYGFREGKLAHTLWLQVGAEVGFLGLGLLVLFYGLCVVRLWPLARGKRPAADPWLPVGARMVIASIVGFAISAQFVSLKGLELPFYVVLIGAGVLKLEPLLAPEYPATFAVPAYASLPPQWQFGAPSPYPPY